MAAAPLPETPPVLRGLRRKGREVFSYHADPEASVLNFTAAAQWVDTPAVQCLIAVFAQRLST